VKSLHIGPVRQECWVIDARIGAVGLVALAERRTARALPAGRARQDCNGKKSSA